MSVTRWIYCRPLPVEGRAGPPGQAVGCQMCQNPAAGEPLYVVHAGMVTFSACEPCRQDLAAVLADPEPAPSARVAVPPRLLRPQ